MKTMILAAVAALSLGVGAAYAAGCSATGVMAGQREPDASDQADLIDAGRTTEEPVDLCITQARYTQLHRHIN